MLQVGDHLKARIIFPLFWQIIVYNWWNIVFTGGVWIIIVDLVSSQYSVIKSSREKSTIAVFKLKKTQLYACFDNWKKIFFIKFEMKYEYFYEFLSSY